MKTATAAESFIACAEQLKQGWRDVHEVLCGLDELNVDEIRNTALAGKVREFKAQCDEFFTTHVNQFDGLLGLVTAADSLTKGSSTMTHFRVQPGDCVEYSAAFLRATGQQAGEVGTRGALCRPYGC